MYKHHNVMINRPNYENVALVPSDGTDKEVIHIYVPGFDSADIGDGVRQAVVLLPDGDFIGQQKYF